MSIDDATPAEWDLSHKAMYKTPPQQTELTFGEHAAARALDLQVGGYSLQIHEDTANRVHTG